MMHTHKQGTEGVVYIKCIHLDPNHICHWEGICITSFGRISRQRCNMPYTYRATKISIYFVLCLNHYNPISALKQNITLPVHFKHDKQSYRTAYTYKHNDTHTYARKWGGWINGMHNFTLGKNTFATEQAYTSTVLPSFTTLVQHGLVLNIDTHAHTHTIEGG